jgi:hypothetical protein
MRQSEINNKKKSKQISAGIISGKDDPRGSKRKQIVDGEFGPGSP